MKRDKGNISYNLSNRRSSYRGSPVHIEHPSISAPESTMTRSHINNSTEE